MLKKNQIHSIWENFQLGDKEAFARLYNLHVDSLFRYGTKITADEDFVKDAIQEVFLDLYIKRQNNKTNPENLKFYLLLALKRDLIKKLKRNRKRVDVQLCDEYTQQMEHSIEKTIIEREEDTEIDRRVCRVLNTLPSKQKETIYLRFNESLEYSEIAEMLNISIESVRKQVYRALKSIRESFGKEPFIFLLLFQP